MTNNRSDATNTAAPTPARRSPLYHALAELGARWREVDGWQQVESLGRRTPEQEATALQERVVAADISAQTKISLRGIKVVDFAQSLFGSEAPDVQRCVDVGIPLHGDGSLAWARLLGLTRDELMLLAGPGVQSRLWSWLHEKVKEREDLITVVDRTDGLAGIAIAGPHAPAVLSKQCGLDFHPQAFPHSMAAQTSLAKVYALVLRWDQADVPAFEIYVAQEHALYVWESLLDAGQEYRLMPTTPPT